MASQDSLKVRKLLASGSTRQTVTDTPVALRMRNVGGGAVTSVTNTTATNIVIITANGGTDTYAYATYTTIGLLADAINRDGIFEVKVLDCLRATLSTSTTVTGAITAGTDDNGVVVWDLLVDTSAALQMGVCLSPFRNFDAPKGHRVHAQELRYAVNMGTAAVDSVQLWKRKGSLEIKLYSGLSVDTTDTTLSWAAGMGMVSGGEDEELILVVKDAATLADATSNYVRITGIIE